MQKRTIALRGAPDTALRLSITNLPFAEHLGDLATINKPQVRRFRIRLLRISQQNLARLGQRDLRAGAIEELNAKIFLKRLDLETHSGLRQIEFLGGLAKAALLCNGPENNQAKIVETRHRMIMALSKQHGYGIAYKFCHGADQPCHARPNS